MRLSTILYYGSAVPIATGVFMAYKAGQIESREEEADIWKKANADADHSDVGSVVDASVKRS